MTWNSLPEGYIRVPDDDIIRPGDKIISMPYHPKYDQPDDVQESINMYADDARRKWPSLEFIRFNGYHKVLYPLPTPTPVKWAPDYEDNK